MLASSCVFCPYIRRVLQTLFYCFLLYNPVSVLAQTQLEAAVRHATQGDFAIAWCLLKPLADRGNAEAQYHLGWMYANGEGLRIDEKHALELWHSAANAGHTEAQFRLAIAYLNGVGTEKDLPQAIVWLKKLFLQGDDDARDILFHLISEDTTEAIDLFKSLLKQNPPVLKATYRVKVDKANMRKGPGKNFKVLKVLKLDSSVYEFETRGNWIHVGVIGSGDFGWLYDSLVEKYE